MLNPDRFKPVSDLVHYLDGLIPKIEETSSELIKEFGNKNLCIYHYQLKKELADKKRDLITFCINVAKPEYPDVTFSHSLLVRFGNYITPFDAGKLIDFIDKSYRDIDKIALDQLRFMIIDQMVEKPRWGDLTEKTPEDIKDIYKAGIELRCPHYHYQQTQLINAVVKFSKIAIGHAQNKHVFPAGVDGLDLEGEKIKEGATYSTNELPSIRLFSNGYVKIRFRTPSEREIFKKSLFMPVWELLLRNEPREKKYKNPCSVCLFKGFSCDECENYSGFVGHCDFCKNKSNYPVGSSTCEQCRNGKDTFSPIEDAKPALIELENIKINKKEY